MTFELVSERYRVMQHYINMFQLDLFNGANELNKDNNEYIKYVDSSRVADQEEAFPF